MARIVICRHGNTFDKGDVVRRVGARTDLPLSQSGQIQAAQLMEGLSDFHFKHAFCSSLRRTRETAEAILSRHKAKLEVLEFLTEIDYGIDENKAETDVIARLGAKAIEDWDKAAIPPSGWHVDPDKLKQAWRDFFTSYQNKDEDVLVVTSNGIARFVLDVAKSAQQNLPRKLHTAAYGVVITSSQGIVIQSWNQRAPAC